MPAPDSGQRLPQSVLVPRLRGMLPNLVPSKRRVAAIIVEAPERAAQMTIGELAEAASTSATTVLRLCRELGIASYRELRIELATESGRAAGRASGTDIGSAILPSDSLDEVIRIITHADASAVRETGELLDRVALAAAIAALTSAGRIDVFGVGASAFVAADLQQKLLRIGRICFAWPDQHAALTATALLGPGDVFIGISHTGDTRDTVDIVKRAGAASATTIGITSAPASHLARSVDHVLITASRETTFRSGAMASRIAALTVVDVLFVAVAQQQYEQTMHAVAATRSAVAHRRYRQSAKENR